MTDSRLKRAGVSGYNKPKEHQDIKLNHILSLLKKATKLKLFVLDNKARQAIKL